MSKLLTDYWEAMRSGKGDVVARNAFGAESYAAKESDSVSNAGYKRRTFLLGESQIRMEKHLKIGVAWNTADTLRVHFEWVNDLGKIVIGHCDRYLDP